MKGVILAGGTGSRLDPLTRITNKHLLPIGDRPMVSYAIEALVRAGLTELMLVTGGTHAGEFFRLPHAPEGRTCHESREPVRVFASASGHRCLDNARRNNVHSDSDVGHLASQRAGKVLEARFARAVDRAIGQRTRGRD